MFWVLMVLAGFAVFAIAAGTVGSVSASMAARPPRPTYSIDEATEYIGDHLPDDITATITYEQVRRVIELRIDYLERKGLASTATAAAIPEDLVMVSEDEPLAWVIGQLEAEAKADDAADLDAEDDDAEDDDAEDSDAEDAEASEADASDERTAAEAGDLALTDTQVAAIFAVDDQFRQTLGMIGTPVDL